MHPCITDSEYHFHKIFCITSIEEFLLFCGAGGGGGGGGVRQRIELHSAYNLGTRITPEKKRKFKENKERKKV